MQVAESIVKDIQVFFFSIVEIQLIGHIFTEKAN